MTISEEVIASIRDRTSVVELVSEVVQLKQSGRNWVGLCPFHKEKTPSFTVRDEEGTFCCFGCGKKGSVFNFVMETRGFSFPEAVEYLANRIGIKITKVSQWKSSSGKIDQQKKDLRRLLYLSTQIYHSVLHDKAGIRGLEYLRQRRLSDETIKRFNLGYSPRAWEFIAKPIIRETGGATESDTVANLMALGLIKRRSSKDERGAATGAAADAVNSKDSAPRREVSSSQCYDVFRDRVIFPITRSDGAPIALGGRIIEADSDAPKYLNTIESPIYQKRRTFYGLSQALPVIRRERQALLVEGYLDVLSMSQLGFHHTIATCGTAVTPEHAQILKRLVDRLVILFDGDVAGRKAAAHCFETFLNTGIDLSVVLLDEGEDPDSLAHRLSLQQFQEMISLRRQPVCDLFVSFLFEQAREAQDSASAVARGKVAEQYVQRINKIKNAVEREILLQRGAELIGVSMDSLSSLLRGVVVRAPRTPRDTAEPRNKPLASSGEQPPLRRNSRELQDNTWTDSIQKSQRMLTRLWRHVIIAVMLEPPLARVILDRVIGGSVDGHRAVGVNIAMPRSIKLFLELVIERNLESIAKEINTGALGGSVLQGKFEQLLIDSEIAVPGLIEEAMEAARIGGVLPEKIIGELEVAWERLSLKGELSNLQIRESDIPDEDSRALLAQEKLLKRRSLERMRED